MSGELPGAEKMKSPSVRVHADLLRRFDEWCERHDTNRSEAFRRFMAQCVSEEDGHVFSEPDNALMRDGFRALRQAVAPDGTVPGTVAKSRIAEQTRVDSGQVGRQVLDPLKQSGYIEVPSMGVIFVPSAVGAERRVDV